MIDNYDNCNSPAGAEQSSKSEKNLFDILKQNPIRYYDLRLANKDQDMYLHYDLAWDDQNLGYQIWVDVKTVMPENRQTGNYSITHDTYNHVFGQSENRMNRYYWALELYDESGEPTGEFRMFNCLALFRFRNEVMTVKPTQWLLHLDDALRLIPESPHDNFVISSDIPV